MNVFIVGRFPPPNDGQTLATRRMAELVGERHEVTRIDVEPPPSGFVENQVTFRWRRVAHYLAQRGTIREKLSSSPSSPVLWPSISPACLGHFRDIIAVASTFPPGQPVAGIVHRAGFDTLFRGGITRPTASWLSRRLSAFVFLTEYQSDKCARWIPEKKRFVIPNAIDRDLTFSHKDIEDRRTTLSEGGQIRLLFLSNMLRMKGYLDVLDAVSILREREMPVLVDFVGRWGSEEDRRAYFHLVDKHELHDVTEYHGGIDDRAAVKEFFRRSDIFVLPTFHPTEEQPVTLIEAANAGLPIITTQQGGIPSMFPQDAALFVAPNSPSDIANAVERLQSRETWITYSKRSRQCFERQFAADVVGSKWETLLEDVSSR